MSSGVKARYSPTFIAFGIWAALVSTSFKSYALVDQDQKSSSDPKATGKNNLTARIAPAHFSSWESCIAQAELGRSDRDLKFFLSALNLSDSKAWFVSHSRANEERFCFDVLNCEQAFGNTYPDPASNYPPC